MIETVSILGVKVATTQYKNTIGQVDRWIRREAKTYICVAAVHLVMECQRDKALRDGVNRAELVVPDGMPLVWLSRLYGHKKTERVYGPTLMLRLCSEAQEKAYRVFLLGGRAGQSKLLQKILVEKFPKLQVVGISDTPMRPLPFSERIRINAKINKAHPDMVFVGMGCPWQEQWMIENRKKLNAPVLVGVGAAFDFLTGRVAQAPTWVQHIGLEWLFRLVHEPRRLWCRYTVLNSQFLLFIVRQLVRDGMRAFFHAS